MLIQVLGKKSGQSKKSGNNYYSIALMYDAFGYEGKFAETRFVDESIFNSVSPGKRYQAYTNFRGAIERVEEVK